MAGVRKFDVEAALDAIDETFRAKGYAATSIEDLERATGLRRGSLYAAFGSKEAMLLAALARYDGSTEGAMLAALAAPRLADALRAAAETALGRIEAPGRPPGCLIAGLTAEAAGRDDAVGAAYRARHAGAVAAFRARLERAAAEGELRDGADPASLAHFLAGAFRAAPILHAISGDPAQARDMLETAVAAVA